MDLSVISTGSIRVHLLAFLDEEKKAEFDKIGANLKEVGGKIRTDALTIYVSKEEGRILEVR